jgi:hypothetical protein
MPLVFGPKQTLLAAGTITTAATVDKYITNCLGARGVLILISGASAANAITVTAAQSTDGATAVTSGIAVTVNPASGACNGAVTAPSSFILSYGSGSVATTGLLTPYTKAMFQAATGDVTGATIVARPFWDAGPGAGSLTMPPSYPD